MPKIIKNTILNYISDKFETEKSVNFQRIYDFNNKPEQKSGTVVYLCEREIRPKDNFALQFAKQKASERNLPLKVICPKIKAEHVPKQKFLNRQILIAKKGFEKADLDFEIFEEDILQKLQSLNPAILIIDFNPILQRSYLKTLDCAIYEIDGHNIVPARFVSKIQEYSSANLRRKIYYNIYPFLTEFDNSISYSTEADEILKEFIETKLPIYNQYRNNPNKNVLSGLSKYLNLGFISSQRVAIEIIKANASNENKETFLDELIVRKELADNFCLYNKNFKTLDGVANWAKESLKNHRLDFRPYFYSLKDLENSKTHDDLWNASQKQLIKEGIIHSYLRMYWAKKIAEWSTSPEDALKTAIYLNDKYAYDAPSSRGYVNILWSVAGLHDRPFQDFFITGKIRRMTYNTKKKKFDIEKYIDKYL